MTVRRAYQTLIMTIILMMTTIILYALNVSKLGLKWGMVGFVITTIFSIFATVFSIHQSKHQSVISKKTFFEKYRFEILDWFSFLSVSMMALFTIFMFFILPSDVKHSSMNPTLEENERILIYHFRYQPERDDIVIVKITPEHYPLVPESMYYEKDRDGNVIGTLDEIFFIKRLYALPGDVITFVSVTSSTYDYYIEINGEMIIAPTNEPYYIRESQKEIMELSLNNNVLKEGLYFAFGDNANGYQGQPASYDARNFGAILEEDLVGKAVFKLWPFGGIDS